MAMEFPFGVLSGQTRTSSEQRARSVDAFRHRTSRTSPFPIEPWLEIDFDIGELYGGEVSQPSEIFKFKGPWTLNEHDIERR